MSVVQKEIAPCVLASPYDECVRCFAKKNEPEQIKPKTFTIPSAHFVSVPWE